MRKQVWLKFSLGTKLWESRYGALIRALRTVACSFSTQSAPLTKRSMMRAFDVSAVNASERLAILDDDQIVHLHNLFDKRGQETDEFKNAVTAHGMSVYGALMLNLVTMQAFTETEISQSLH